MDTFRLAFDVTVDMKKTLDKLPHGMRRPLYSGMIKLILPLIEEGDWNTLHAIQEGDAKLEIKT